MSVPEIRAQLTAIGAKRAEFLRLRTEAAEAAAEWVPRAHAAGIHITEIAELAHLSRQHIHELLRTS